MPFRSNAHTHTTFCDGKTPIREMIARAEELGFVSLGFSEHAVQGFDLDYSMSPDRQKSYFEQLRAIQAERLPSQPKIWAGLELDALADESLRQEDYKQADYIIGSVHYLPWEGKASPVAVDGPAERLGRYVDTALHGDGLELARRYYAIVAQSLLRDKPAIIGHFDLVRKHAAKLNLFDESDPRYRRIALTALEQAFPCGAVLEVNTGGMARGYLSTPYPTLDLLCAWREMGGKITLTSDCHDARYLNYAFDTALRLIQKAGFRSLMQLGQGEDLWEETEIVANPLM